MTGPLSGTRSRTRYLLVRHKVSAYPMCRVRRRNGLESRGCSQPVANPIAGRRGILFGDQIRVFSDLRRSEGETGGPPLVGGDQFGATNPRHLLAGQVHEAEAIEQKCLDGFWQCTQRSAAVVKLAPPAVISLRLGVRDPPKHVCSRILNAFSDELRSHVKRCLLKP